MYVDYVWDKEDNIFQSVIFIAPKCQNDTLECTLEEANHYKAYCRSYLCETK